MVTPYNTVPALLPLPPLETRMPLFLAITHDLIVGIAFYRRTAIHQRLVNGVGNHIQRVLRIAPRAYHVHGRAKTAHGVPGLSPLVSQTSSTSYPYATGALSAHSAVRDSSALVSNANAIIPPRFWTMIASAPVKS